MSSQVSPFLPAYQNRGAELRLEDGIEVAAWVESFQKEYRASRERAILVDRTHRSLLRVSGKDRESFLHNMLSQDVKSLRPGSGRPACFLTNKGKLIADMTVSRDEDYFWLMVESSRREPLEAALTRYIISEDVAIEETSPAVAALSIEGPSASQLLDRIRDDGGSGSIADLDDLAPGDLLRLASRGTELLVTGARFGPGPGFELWIPWDRASTILEVLLIEGADLGVELAGREAAETRRIEIGRPRFGRDMDETHLPLEVGLDEAIHYEKGCYIGQEYIVRLVHRGQVSRKLVGLKLQSSEAPEPGASITSVGEDEPQELGLVTSAAVSPAMNAAVALGFVKRGFFEPGTRLAVTGVPAEVCAFPMLST